MYTIMDNRDKKELNDQIDGLSTKINNDIEGLKTYVNGQDNKLSGEISQINVDLRSLVGETEGKLQKNINDLAEKHHIHREELSANITSVAENAARDITKVNRIIENTKSELNELIVAENGRATGVENSLSSRIATMEAFFKEADIDASQDFIDTLTEIQSYIKEDESGAAEMSASIKKNANDLATYKTSNDTAVQKVASDLSIEINRATQAEEKALSDAKAYADEVASGKVSDSESSIQVLLDKKVDKVDGKVLTDNNLSNDLKTKYDAAYEHSQAKHAPIDAEKNIQSDWNETNSNSDAYISNKPTIGALAAKDKVEMSDLSEEIKNALNKIISMQVADGYIQYSIDGGTTWTDLLAISDIIA